MKDETLRFPVLDGVKPKVDPRAAVCGNCFHFGTNPNDISMGYCHGNPPLAVMQAQPNGAIAVHGFRPPVKLNDLGCRHFKPEGAPVK